VPVTTPTLILCDNLVTALAADWTPAAPDGVERAYFKRISDASGQVLKLKGRRVVIYPTDYDNNPLTRDKDVYLHKVSVQIFELFDEDTAGDPPIAWTDARVDFVFEKIVQGFDYSRQSPTWNRWLRTLSATTLIVNTAKLIEDRMFFSQVDLEFEEERDP